VTKHLSENLIDLSRRRLRAHAAAKLGLNHGERGLDVRPLVVVLQEFFAVIGEEIEQPMPKSAALMGLPIHSMGSAVRLERDERIGTRRVNRVKVSVSDVGAVSGDCLKSKPLGGRLEEGG